MLKLRYAFTKNGAKILPNDMPKEKVKIAKLDAEQVMNALDCRSKYDPDNPNKLPDPDFEPNCANCKYCYDYDGCDLTHLLEDAAETVCKFLSTRRCYTCYWRKHPDDCEHWLPCQVMETDDMWHCADWRHPYD